MLLTALNFLNYIDRSVLFAVQPLVQAEFHRSDAQFGFLTTAFFLCYMIAAPIMGVLADRYERKWIIIGGAIVWSAATLLTALVGATFAADSDRVIVRLKGADSAKGKTVAERQSLAMRLTAQSGLLMRPLRIMGDGSQVMQLFQRLPQQAIHDRIQD